MIRSVVLFAAVAAFALPAHAAGDPVAGKKVFAKCAACHGTKAGEKKIGPTLFKIYGRTGATVPGFKYSPAATKAHVKWTDANLHNYLENPKKFMPGNRMAFAGLAKPRDRDNVIAYLATLK